MTVDIRTLCNKLHFISEGINTHTTFHPYHLRIKIVCNVVEHGHVEREMAQRLRSDNDCSLLQRLD